MYKTPSSDTYIIFGQAVVDSQQDHALQSAAKSMGGFDGAGLGNMEAAGASAAAAAAPAASGAAPAAASTAASGGDEDGVSATDIELVLSQTNATRAQAVAALKKTKG